jgi:hypothetical protein
MGALAQVEYRTDIRIYSEAKSLEAAEAAGKEMIEYIEKFK